MSAGAGSSTVVIMRISVLTKGEIVEVVIAVLLPVTTMKLTRPC